MKRRRLSGGNVHIRRERRVGHVGPETSLHSLYADVLETRPVVLVSGSGRKLARPLSAQPPVQSDHFTHGIPSQCSVLPRHVHSQVHAVWRPHSRPHRYQDGQLDIDKTVLGGNHIILYS